MAHKKQHGPAPVPPANRPQVGPAVENSSGAQHRQGHLNVRTRGDLASNVLDVDAFCIAGTGEKQATEELAGRRGVHGDIAAR